MQVGLGLVIAIGSVLLVGIEPRARELPLARWAFGATGVTVGVANLAYPDRVGALGAWALCLLIVVWGVLLLLPIGQRTPREVGSAAPDPGNRSTDA